MKKIKLISHTDLDGFGCNYVLSELLGDKYKLDLENVNYDVVNERVLDIINNTNSDYDKVYITDISVNNEVAELIDELNKKDNNKIMLFDHHKSSLDLNKYDWCDVKVDIDGVVTSGTELFAKYILKEYSCDIFKMASCEKLEIIANVIEFVENVRLYDTWEWDRLGLNHIKDLNSLFWILGACYFGEKLKECNYNTNTLLNEFKIVLTLENKREEEYISNKNKTLVKGVYGDYKVGLVFAEQYTSSLGNKLSLLNTDCDFIIIVNENKISLRTVKDNIYLSLIAGAFGGGGHKKAAGFEIPGVLHKMIFKELGIK